MMGYKQVCEARLSGDKRLLNEVSLGKVYSYVKNSPDKSMTIISANRGELTKKQNREATKKLDMILRSGKFPHFKLIGAWYECTDPKVDYKDCPPEKKKLVKELSYGVIGLTKKEALKLTKQFKQDAIVYLGKETGGDAILIFNNGSEQKIGKFNPNKIADAFSRVSKNTAFAFEGFDYIAQSWSNALIESVAKKGLLS